VRKVWLTSALAVAVGWALSQPAGGAFLRYTAQALTGPQQAQVRTNLGLGTAATQNIGNLPQTTLTSSQTIAATARGTVVRCDATSAPITLPLPASPSTGDWLITSKSDGSANRCTIQISGVDAAWLSAQHDDVCWRHNGSTWIACWVDIAPLRQIILTTQNWTKPPLLKRLEVKAVGGGGGGGGGAAGIATANRTGGGGGAGGYYQEVSVDASVVPSIMYVEIGAGGIGGNGGIAGGGNGTIGTAGGGTFVGDLIQAFGSPAGGAGLASGTTIAGGANGLGLGLFGTNSGGAGNSTAGGATTDNLMAAGGGGGGGLNTSNAQAVGGIGGRGGRFSNSSPAAAAGGTVGGGAGGTPTSISATFPVRFLGGGGGGGGGSSNVNTVNGGAGGFPGGGGGGGGAALSGGTAVGGRGGNGGAGAAELVSYF
jgi:hypothetical protein